MKAFLLFVIGSLVSSVTFSQDSLYSRVFYDNQPLEGETSCLSFHDGLLLVSNVSDGANVLLIDSLGQQLWSINLGFATGIPDFNFNLAIQTIDSCFLLAGNALNHNDSQYEGYLVKINQSGDTVWTRMLTTNSISAMTYDETDIYSIVQQADSSFVFVGTAGPLDQNSNQRMLTGKIDFDGELVWSHVYEAFDYSVRPRKIIANPNNNYFIAGQLYDESNLTVCTSLLAEITQSGNLIWSKKIHSVKVDDAILQDSALFFIAESDQPGQAFLFKTDLSGNAVWNNLYTWHAVGPNEQRLRLTRLSNHQLLMHDGSDFGSGSNMYKLDTAANFLESKYLLMGARDIFERNNKGHYIVGVGPLIGVRAGIYEPQVGVIKTDSLFQYSDCIQQSNPMTTLQVPTVIDTLYSLTVADTLVPRSINITANPHSLMYFEGCVSYLDGLNEVNSLLFSVYPNSSTGIFNLEQESPESLIINILDSQGKMIAQHKMSDYSSTIDLSQQADGIYFYKAVSSDNRMKTGKLVVVK